MPTTIPALDADASWLPLEQVADCHAVLADVRWPEGAAAVFDAAARYGIVRVFDGDVGPREALIDLAQRATHVVFSEPGLAHAPGVGCRATALRDRRDVRGIVGVTLGADGLSVARRPRERRIPRPRSSRSTPSLPAMSGTARSRSR